MKKWLGVVLLILLSIGGALAHSKISEAATLVTVSLPDGAQTEYKIGETVTLHIVFNEKVNMTAGAIPAGMDGEGRPMMFRLVGAANGEFKQVYEAKLLVLPSYPSGKIQLGNLEGIAITSDGISYYDSSIQTVQYDSSVENLALDTQEIDWNPKVFVSDQEVTEPGFTAERGEIIRIQLFSMNVGINGANYYGEYQGLELNGTGQWANNYRIYPQSGDYRNGIHLDRYTYEFFYQVQQNVVMNPLQLISIVRDQTLNHNGKAFALVLPEDVKTTISNLNLLVDGRLPSISVDVTSDSEPKNRETRKVAVTANDESGIDVLYYKWAKVGSELDQYYWGFHTNGVASGQPVPILPEDVPTDGNYHLYIRAVDNAGNENNAKYGPYHFKVNVPNFVINPASGTRFGGDDPSEIGVALDETTVTNSVSYSWSNDDGVIVSNEPLSGTGPWTIGDMPVGNDVYHLKLSFTDDSNNSMDATYTFVRDLYAPTVIGDVNGIDITVPHQTLDIPIKIEAKPDDDTASGDSYKVYQLWNTSASTPPANDTGWDLMEDGSTAASPSGLNGEMYLHVKVVDIVGNETIHTVGGFLFDNMLPVLNESADMAIACSKQYNDSFTSEDCSSQASVNETPINALTLQLTIDSVTDVSDYTIEYYVTSQPTLAYTGKYPVNDWKIAENGKVEVSGYHGVRYIVLKVTDLAGNSKLFLTDGYTFDSGGAVGGIEFSKDYVNTKSVSITPSVAGDVTELRYSFDGVNFSEFSNFTNGSAISVDLPADANGDVAEQSYTIYVQFKDTAGNVGDTFAQDTTTYDITPPVVNRVEKVEDDETGNVIATVYYSDHFSPTSDSIAVTFTENGTKDVEITDAAGNSIIYTITVDQLDHNGPTVQFMPWGNMDPKKSVQTTVTVHDTQSGVDGSTLQYVWHDNDALPNVGDIAWQPFSSGDGDTISMDSDSGTWYLFVKAIDLKGNEVIVRSDAFLLDNHPPESYIAYSFNVDESQQIPLKTPGPIVATVKANHDQINGLGYTFGKAFTIIKIVKVNPDETETPLYGGEGCPELEGGCPSEMTFTENTSDMYRFYTKDAAGNISYAETKEIHVIDTNFPKINISETPNSMTNASVDVSIQIDQDFKDTTRFFDLFSNGELIKVVTKDNAIFENDQLTEIDLSSKESAITEVVYRFTSELGFIEYSFQHCSDTCTDYRFNRYTVQNLDQTPPSYEVIYSIPELSESEIAKYPEFYTNRDVTVRLMPEDLQGDVTFTSPGGATHTFTKNGSHTFVFQDEAGNVVEKTVTMNRIQKGSAEAVVTYEPSSWTNRPVIATIQFDPDGTGRKVKIEGTEELVSSAQFTFDKNGSRIVSFTDEAGNSDSISLQVDWIDLIKPTGTVTFSKDHSGNLVATLSTQDNSGLRPTVTDASGNELPGGETYVFTDNESHTFYFKDAAGNIGSVQAIATNIDHEPPVLNMKYSNEIWIDENGDGTPERKQIPTNGSVRVIIDANEIVTLTNYEGADIFSHHNKGYLSKQIYDFNQNGEVKFVFADQAGNTEEINVSINSIDRAAPIVNISYSTETETKDNVIATVSSADEIQVLNNGGRTQYIFQKNGKFTFIVSDLAGNIVEADAEVNWINTAKVEYKVEYSETSPTQNNVTAAIMVKDGDTWKQLTNELTATDGSSISPVHTFEKNGAKWIQAKDPLGNKYMIELLVMNIDHEDPLLSFTGQLLVPIGGEVNPLEGLHAVDNLDGEILEKVSVTSNTINPEVTGEYQVVYEATDSAGNTASITRKAAVISNEQLMVFVNGELPENINFIEDNTIDLTIFGSQGEKTIHWAYGRLQKGDFKGSSNLLEGTLKVSLQGYYTFYVQDQERNYQLIHVYVIPSGGRDK